MTAKFSNWRDLANAASSSESTGSPARTSDARANQVEQPALVTPKGLTPAMLEEALANAHRALGFSESKMSAMMGMLKNDAAGAVSQCYQMSKMAAAKQRASVAREDLVVKYVLTDDESSALTDYAKEFRLVFRGREQHDHAMAAACRMIDQRLIAARLPFTAPVSDVGGNPLVYIRSGQDHVHVCGPMVDVKDQMRHILRRAEVKRICGDVTLDPDIRALARKYQDKDPDFVCNKRAQECDVKTPVLTAVHVYDVPLQDWPDIMERKGASVVEGCLLFSEKFFEKTEGVLDVAGARYEIDLPKNEFRMGFRDSPSWWYTHNWSDYAAYGVDQTLHAGNSSYSYKVVERRKDTLFFRILRLGRVPIRGERTVLRRPGVKMVEVNGFELNKTQSVGSRVFKRKKYLFPRNLWFEMVTQASEDFERGVMDYTRMYAHYRTISVRQTINAVCVMGGEPVSSDELMPLVVHSCIAAAAQCMLGQRETRMLTSVAMEQRVRLQEGTFKKLGLALLSVAKTCALLPLYPFQLLDRLLREVHASALESWVLDWEPQVEFIEVDSKLLFATAYPHAVPARQLLHERAVETAGHDYIHAVATNPELREAIVNLFSGGSELVDSVAPGVPQQSVVDTALPSYHTEEQIVPLPLGEPDVRKAAIREHLAEIQMMNRAVESTCAEAYAKLCVAGNPSVSLLKKHAENYRNPDLWKVTNGVMVQSALGVKPVDFKHSAVYYPVPDLDTKSRVRAVYDSVYDGMDSDGNQEHREHKILSDSLFCGWVLVTDDLLIYNGPEIMQSMEMSLSLDHDYSVAVERGPPGCGKTYSIVTQFQPGTDFVVCPVKESITDTRKQISERHPEVADLKMTARTIDSYLTNYRKGKNAQLRTDRLLVDECYMTHAGKIYSVAALLGAKAVLAFGDEFQIPHIPRVQASKTFLKLRTQSEKHVWTTRRCPASAVAAWGGVYNWKVRSLSKVDGEMRMVNTTKGRTIPNGCVMMCMYQADKVELRKRYAADLNRIKILTAHEAEGKTYRDVWLHRFDARRRADKSSLFDQQPHVLVAMSRHTHSFIYCCPADLGDLPSQWIKRASNPRRIAASLDVETQGSSLELL